MKKYKLVMKQLDWKLSMKEHMKRKLCKLEHRLVMKLLSCKFKQEHRLVMKWQYFGSIHSRISISLFHRFELEVANK